MMARAQAQATLGVGAIATQAQTLAALEALARPPQIVPQAAPQATDPAMLKMLTRMEQRLAMGREVNVTIEGQVVDEKTLKKLIAAIRRELTLSPAQSFAR